MPDEIADLLWEVSHASSEAVALDRSLRLVVASTAADRCAVVTERAVVHAHGAAAGALAPDALLHDPATFAVALDREPRAWLVAGRPDGPLVARDHVRITRIADFLSLSLALLRSRDEEEALRADRDRDSRRLRDAERELAHQAEHDRVTGLTTREAMLERTRRLLARAATRGGRSVAAIVIDLDGFRRVNDSLAQREGDRLLRAVGERLTAVVGEREGAGCSLAVGRYGSDEFVVLGERIAGERAAVEVAEAVRTALRRPFTLGDRALTLTCSIGIACSSRAADADRFMSNAEVALERAKELGGDRFEVFDEAMRARVVDRARLAAELRDGIARGELRLLYQPVVSVAESRLSAVEALVRWEHPTRGLLGPGEFIGLAEGSELIVELGAWVIDEACAQIRRWRECHPAALGLRVSVNVSTRQLSPELVRTVTDALRRHGVAPSQLALEITETMLAQRTEESRRLLHELADLGVCIVLDDFGTGYSSLSYLRDFPLHQLKLDRSFCAGLEDDLRAAKLVAATIEMARALGMTVVAEGVETVAQLTVLRRLGSDFAQGFWFARPEPPEDVFARMLAAYEADRRVAGGRSPAAGTSPASPTPPHGERRASPARRRSDHRAAPYLRRGGLAQIAAGAMESSTSAGDEAGHRLALGRLFGLLFIGAPLIELSGDLVMRAPTLLDVAWLTTMAILTGLVCLLMPWDRLGERALHAFAGLGTVELTIAAVVDGPHAIVVAPFYPLAAATIAYGFGNRRAIALQATFIVLSMIVVPLSVANAPSDAVPVAVTGALVTLTITAAVVFLREQLRGSLGQLRRLADADALTGASNHRILHERLELELAGHRRSGEALAVLLIDLDGFKQVNERLGHAAGDDVLRRVARTLRDAARAQDTVARPGGDEFAVLAPATDADGAAMLAERLRQRVRRLQFAGETLDATIGVAVYPADGDTPDALLAHADSHLLGTRRLAGRPSVTAAG